MSLAGSLPNKLKSNTFIIDEKFENDKIFARMETKPSEYFDFDCWLNYRQLQPGFEQILSAWFAKKDTFWAAVYLYAGNKKAVSMNEEYRFMNAVTGFESFHYATKERS